MSKQYLLEVRMREAWGVDEEGEGFALHPDVWQYQRLVRFTDQQVFDFYMADITHVLEKEFMDE